MYFVYEAVYKITGRAVRHRLNALGPPVLAQEWPAPIILLIILLDIVINMQVEDFNPAHLNC